MWGAKPCLWCENLGAFIEINFWGITFHWRKSCMRSAHRYFVLKVTREQLLENSCRHSNSLDMSNWILWFWKLLIHCIISQAESKVMFLNSWHFLTPLLPDREMEITKNSGSIVMVLPHGWNAVTINLNRTRWTNSKQPRSLSVWLLQIKTCANSGA